MKIPFQQYWDLLAQYIRPQRRRFVSLTILLLSSIGMQLINPQIMRFFIDTTQGGSASGVLLMAALAFIGIAILQQVIGVSATYLGENVAWTATNALRADVARHCLNLDMSYHNNVSPGELIERIDGDVAELSNFFSQLVVRVLGNLLLLLGILAALLFEDWRIGLAFAVFTALTMVALYAVHGIAIPYQKKFREAIADLFGYMEERLAGTEDIRSSGAVDFVLLGVYKLSSKILGYWRSVQRRFMVVRLTAGMLMTSGVAMSLAIGFYLFRDGLITLGTVYLIVTYTNLLRRPIRELTQQVENLQNIGAATERLRELRAIEAKIVDGVGTELDSGALGLAFENVDFAYKEGEQVLAGIDFNLQPGTVLGLLGRTGSGKTTLARLIFRLYDPTQGKICLNGVPLTDTHLKTLRERVDLVEFSPVYMDGKFPTVTYPQKQEANRLQQVQASNLCYQFPGSGNQPESAARFIHRDHRADWIGQNHTGAGAARSAAARRRPGILEWSPGGAARRIFHPAQLRLHRTGAAPV